jgi:hypothetical protein
VRVAQLLQFGGQKDVHTRCSQGRIPISSK